MLSFWQQDTFLKPADVVIAGGGFMGLWSAYELKKQYPKLAITIVEKDNLPGGASVRNAGFACFGSPGELLADAATMGEETMWQIVEMRYQGIQKIRQVLGNQTINYDDCGGYECFRDVSLFGQVADQLPWLNGGMKNSTGKDNVFGIEDNRMAMAGVHNFKHLIANRLEGGLHSGNTMRALLQKVLAMGILILNGACVKNWQNNGSTIEIAISGTAEATLTASRFLITTNAFIPQIVSAMPVQCARGQVLVTRPIPGLQLRGTFHFNEGFYYWRNVGNRILLGGARNLAFEAEATTEMAISDTIQSALENFLHEHILLPSKPIEIEYRWAGIMGFTQNKQPVIQAIAPGVWVAIACNGMGVALSPVLAAEVVTQMMG